MADYKMTQSELLECGSCVLVPRGLYDVLVSDSFAYGILVDVIFGNASLSWSDNTLSISDDALNPILKAFFPDDYQMKLEALKKAKGDE